MSQNFEQAREIVQELKAGGHEAFFAGGCVRDHLLGVDPKDYDIATSAKPEQVEGLFSNTIGVGKQFGVIIVCRKGRNFDVATFRADGNYGDGRRPDQISFASAKEDVLRRDLTINGLLMDPESMQVVDYVGGKDDLKSGIIRTIGDPSLRFGEDHLRILRALRFACRFGFQIESETKRAIQRLADKAANPSAERIFGELDRMLTERAPHQALELMDDLGVLAVVLPEVAKSWGNPLSDRLNPKPNTCLTHKDRAKLIFSRLSGPISSELAWSILLSDLDSASPVARGKRATQVLKNLRAANSLMKACQFLVTHRDRLLFACRISQARQRLLLAHFDLDLIRSFVYCESAASNPDSVMERNFPETGVPLPKANLDGKDLMDLGVPKGRTMGRVLKKLRFLQLQGQHLDREQAVEWVRKSL